MAYHFNMKDWTPFQEIDFSDAKVFMYSVDTRDFNCTPMYEKPEKDLNLPTLLKYKDRFFHTPESVKEILTRLFEESGGKKEWRNLSLCGDGARYSNGWELKYLRIHRTEHGLVICDRHHYALNRAVLNSNIDNRYLNAH